MLLQQPLVAIIILVTILTLTRVTPIIRGVTIQDGVMVAWVMAAWVIGVAVVCMVAGVVSVGAVSAGEAVGAVIGDKKTISVA